MTLPQALPALPIAIPLLGAATLAGLRRWLNRAAADTLAIACAALTLAVSCSLLLHAVHTTTVYWLGNWHPRGIMAVGIDLVIEPIGAGLATLAAVLVLQALLFSWRFVHDGGNHFQPLMLVFLAAMSGFVLTGDLFNLFVFFELMSTSAFALCGLKTAEPAPLQGALNFAVTNTLGAFLVLTGIALLYAVTGSLNLAQIGLALGGRHDPLVLFAFTIITCGFLIKAAIVPFHLWLPDAHAVAPTPVCVLFSGLMVELGIYAVVRLRFVIFAQTFAQHELALRHILFLFAAATILAGGLMCYAEHHLKRLLAFSTICHAGLLLLAFALNSPLAIAAMFVYILAHALLKSGLFFVSGVLLHHLRSISERELFAKGKALWWTATLWFLGGAGLAAAPCFGLSIAEAGVSKAAEQAHAHGVEFLFLFGGGMTCAAVWRVGMHTFFGWGDTPITDRAADIGELPETPPEDRKIFWYHIAPPTFCIAAAIAMNVAPGWLPALRNAAAALVNPQAYAGSVYLNQTSSLMQPDWHDALPGAALRGSFALLLAALLAATSVFRLRLKRALRLGAMLERGSTTLRTMQSGNPADYVLWIVVGLVAFGSSTLLFLRR